MVSPFKADTLIIGCGYAGLPLALKLKGLDKEVLGWVNSESGAEAVRTGLGNAIIGDVSDPQIWQDQAAPHLKSISLVIFCASSNRGGPEAYDKVFLRGSEQVLIHCPEAQLVFVSSTSVYGQVGGEIVSEDSLAEPTTETGKILRSAEEQVLRGGGIVARSAGIYGPGRAINWEKFLSGQAVLEGGGSKYMNQIHRDDLVEALCLLARRGCRGSIYNISDDEPVSYRDFYTWCGERLGRPLPPAGPENKNRKRGLTNKQVSNAKLRELGWTPQFPSFREGLLAMTSS